MGIKFSYFCGGIQEQQNNRIWHITKQSKQILVLMSYVPNRHRFVYMIQLLFPSTYTWPSGKTFLLFGYKMQRQHRHQLLVNCKHSFIRSVFKVPSSVFCVSLCICICRIAMSIPTPLSFPCKRFTKQKLGKKNSNALQNRNANNCHWSKISSKHFNNIRKQKKNEKNRHKHRHQPILHLLCAPPVIIYSISVSDSHVATNNTK